MLTHSWTPETSEPARNFSRSHYGRHIVYFPSLKNNKQLICESRLEADYCVQLEHDKNVRVYFPQPVTHELNSFNRKVKYTPDFFVRTEDGDDYFVEVKPNFSSCSEQYQETLDLFELSAAKFNYSFRRSDCKMIRSNPLTATLNTLYFKSQHTTNLEYDYLLSLITARHLFTLAGLLALPLPPSPRAIARAIFLGDIAMKLDEPLTLTTELSAE